MNPDKDAPEVVRNIPMARPLPNAVQEMPIRRADWRRLRAQVNDLGNLGGGTVALNIALWFFGSSLALATAILSIPDEIKNQNAVLEALFWAGAGASAVIGVVCLVFHFMLKARHTNDVTRICTDMDEMERAYEWSVGGNGGGAGTSSQS